MKKQKMAKKLIGLALAAVLMIALVPMTIVPVSAQTYNIIINNREGYGENGLEMYIDECQPFYSGFYYYDAEGWFIQMNSGIQGKFHYSRELTKYELDNWWHGGILYDIDYNYIDCVAWSNHNGFFAVEFTEDIEPGDYIYHLHQTVGAETVNGQLNGGSNCGAYIYITVTAAIIDITGEEPIIIGDIPGRAPIIDPPQMPQINGPEPYEYAFVTDEQSAVGALQVTIDSLSDEQKEDAAEIDILMLFAEEAVAQAASETFDGDSLNINKINIENLQGQAAKVKAALEETITESGIEIMRDMKADVKFKTGGTKKVTITVEPSAANTTADNVRAETPDFTVTIPREAIIEGTKTGNLVITVEEIEDSTPPVAMLGFSGYIAANTSGQTKYKVTMNKDLTENIKYSFDPAPSGDPIYQAVLRSNGDAVGGKYNPITGKIETRIRYSDTYTVKENKKNFGDISSKSTSMQEAINVLASKGIINGTSATTFSPDSSITRAEIAALIVRTLSRLDPNADGGFTDVKKTDWYFGAVGSAKNCGIINGTSATTFSPTTQIRKEQIIAIAARTLRSEMKWKTPTNIDMYLRKFADRSDLPSWGTDDFALASMADLIVLRVDGKFNPSDTMTRGDAAIVLYRLFMKLW